MAFGVLLLILNATQMQFRTGWFVESVVSAALIVIRPCQPFFRSRPGKFTLIPTLGIVALTVILSYTPPAGLFGICPLPVSFLLLIVIVALSYIITAEIVKSVFYRKVRL